MKQLLFVLFLIFATTAVSAQYKKASFFTKGGRTYTLGATFHQMGDGKGTPIGFFYSGGKDNTDKRLFRWYELEFLPAYRFSYQTMGYNYNNSTGIKEPVTISGKSQFQFLYNFNLGYHLLNRSEGEKKINPYVFAGVDLLLLGGASYTSGGSETHYEFDKNLSEETVGIGFRGGVGALLNFSEKIALKTDLGYNVHYNLDLGEYTTPMYYTFANHMFLSTGIRFRFSED
jgi:hypothetical protein